MSVEIQAAQTVESVIWYGFGVMLAMSGALLTIVFKMTQKQAQDQKIALDQKASSEALKEAETRLARTIEMHISDQKERFRGIEDRQIREIDRITKDMDALTASVNELRRDVGAGNLKILDGLHELMTIQRSQMGV
jgi:Na+-translocating ferredoxin:NAD+ oxidoreductase RnfG subunit